MESGASAKIVGNPRHPYTQLLIASTAGSVSKTRLGETSIESPDLFEGRMGCPFAHRCPLRTDVCVTEEPMLRDIDESHLVACHHQG